MLGSHHQLHGARKPEIPDQHCGTGSQTGAQGRHSPAGVSLVGNIVVKEGGVVQQLGGRGIAYCILRNVSSRAGICNKQAHQRAEHLARIAENRVVDRLEKLNIRFQGLPEIRVHLLPGSPQICDNFSSVHRKD